MLAPLDNETIFKLAFTDKVVFTQFVKDTLGIDIVVNKIETEKKFNPKVGYIDFAYDIFAESVDHRVIIEIQRVDLDYNFDRFLHYHMMAIAQLQKAAKDYSIERKIYTIVILTAPYKLVPGKRAPIQDEVMISSMDPRNLEDRVVPIYGHKLVFLNHHYRKPDTPVNYADWMDLIHASIHNPESFEINTANRGIKKAAQLIDYDKLDPALLHEMKLDVARKVTRKLDRDSAKEEGRTEGKAESQRDMAKKSLEKGLSIDLIAELTGLSPEEIQNL